MQIGSKKSKAVLLLLFFLFCRFLLETYWRFVSEYYSYCIEVAFVTVVYLLFKKDIRLWKRFDLMDGIFSLAFLVAGMLIFKITTPMGLIVPFDLSSRETIFLLLIVAPLLEELLFRMAIWETLKVIYNRNWFIIGATTVLFSIGHLAAYWFVPDEFKAFVLYQGTYVIFLAIALGMQRLKSNSVNIPVLLHFAFNLGFYLGSKI